MEKSESVIDLLEKELFEKNFINKPIDREILTKVDVIGFDIDHTLSIYNTETMVELLYTSFAKYLVEHLKYPRVILIYDEDLESDSSKLLEEKHLNLKFKEDFVRNYSNNEVIVDLITGNVLTIDESKRVIKAFHGIKELSHDEIENYYGKEKEYSEFEFESRGGKYEYVMGNFEYHVIPLYLICVHLFDEGELSYLNEKNYKKIYDDIIESLLFNYILYDKEKDCIKSFKETGYFFPELYKNPKKYLFEYSAKEMLKHLKDKEIGLFFATNSFFEYADFILKNTIGEDYIDYFNLGFFYAKKPSFFYKDSQTEAFFTDLSKNDNKIHPGISSNNLKDETTFHQVQQNKRLIGGSYSFVEEFFRTWKKKDNLKFVYVGDNFYSDCTVSSKLENWESVAVCEHIKTGFIGSNPKEFRRMWEIENSLGLQGENKKENIFYTKILRENTLFSVSNVDTFKYLK